MHKEQPRNKAAAFKKLAEKIKKWHTDQLIIEKFRSQETIRTYHAVDNRVKDHESGFTQSYDEVKADIGDMVEARRQSKLQLE